MQTFTTFPRDPNKKTEEHREYSRLPAETASISNAELFFGDHQRCMARVLNVSAGGLFCRLSENSPIPTVRDSINRVLLFRDGREPVNLSGTVRRLEYRAGDMSCAIEFANQQTARLDSKTNRPLHSAQPQTNEQIRQPATRISVDNFIGRLYTAPALRTPQGRSRAEWQLLVTSSFHDLLGHMKENEHWWFVHVLELLKEAEPDYPDALLAEYMRLCRKGFGNDRSHGVV